MRNCLVLCLVVCFGAMLMNVFANDNPAAKTKVLKHVVMYKFREDCTPEQVQEVVTAFSGLPAKIDTILAFEKGTNVSQEGKSEGLTHCFVVTFANEEGLKVYLEHAAHAEYVNVVKTKREKVIVFDYWLEQ
jgi:Stress responsive A/B Barrel Domain